MEEGCPIHFYSVDSFEAIWTMKITWNLTQDWRISIFFFLCGDQNLLLLKYIKNEKENYLKKRTELAATADIFGRSK